MLRNSANSVSVEPVSTQPTINNNPEALLAYYQNTSDSNRESIRFQMQQIDNNSLIAQYQAINEDERSEFVANLNANRKKVLFDHFLSELQVSAWNLQRNQHPGGEIASTIVTQLRSIQESSLQQNEATRFSDDHFLNVLHAATNFIRTPVLNQDNTANVQFSNRATELAATSAKLRTSGNQGVLKGLLDTFLALACIGGAVVLGLYTFGIIGAASALTKAIGPMAMGMETMFGVKYAVSAIGKFASGHRALSVSNKLNNLVKTMQKEAEPAIEASQRPAL